MNSFICWVLGHKYFVIKSFSSYSRKVGCSRCFKTWAMNDDAKVFLPWDIDFENFHAKDVE